MNNFIFENGTRVVFGKGCVKEYLGCFSRHFGETVMLSKLRPGANVVENALILSRNNVADSEKAIVQWADGLGI